MYRAELILNLADSLLINKEPCPKISIHNLSEIKVPYYIDSDGNSQVSASTKWLALAEPTCNWQLSMSVHGDINVP